MKRLLFGMSLAAVLLLAETGYKIEARWPVPGTGGWDYVTFDGAAGRLYISHATQVEVLDAGSGKMIGTIPDTPGVHGIALATAYKHGFTSNGRENKVSMFDPETLKLIRKIDVGKGPDGIYYDPSSKRVFTNNHGSHDISAIDAVTGELVGTVKADADGEQAVIGKDGNIYVNNEEGAEVVVFDPKSLAVKNRYPIGVAKTPTGLAYDSKNNRLFVACREKPTLVVMDAGSGKVITSMPIGGGVDWAEFDPGARLVMTSNGAGTISVYHQKSADQYEDAGAIQTMQSAKTMAFDPKSGRIFAPAAEYEMTPATDGKQPRRVMKAGSFVVLVIGK